MSRQPVFRRKNLSRIFKRENNGELQFLSANATQISETNRRFIPGSIRFFFIFEPKEVNDDYEESKDI
jgi:hypothetical protein